MVFMRKWIASSSSKTNAHSLNPTLSSESQVGCASLIHWVSLQGSFPAVFGTLLISNLPREDTNGLDKKINAASLLRKSGTVFCHDTNDRYEPPLQNPDIRPAPSATGTDVRIFYLCEGWLFTKWKRQMIASWGRQTHRNKYLAMYRGGVRLRV